MKIIWRKGESYAEYQERVLAALRERLDVGTGDIK